MLKDIIKTLVFFIGSLWIISSNASAREIDCDRHKIYCHIKRNNPRLSHSYTMEVSNIIYKVSRKHRIPANIYTAILMQESSYKKGARGCHSGLDKETGEEVTICADFGISMINYKTAKLYNFDLQKIMNDLEYGIEAGAIVLSGFKKRYSRREKDYWTRYNANNKTKRLIYKKLVERFL